MSAADFSTAIFFPISEVVVNTMRASGLALRKARQKGTMAFTSPAEEAWSQTL